MKITVEKDTTLLVDGPASVTSSSGIAEVFGFQVKNERKIVIRGGKRLPFFVKETANFNISLGAEAGFEEIEGDTIPKSWVTAFNFVREFEKQPIIVMVLGRVDSGKTSFCSYLANKLIGEKFKVAILDEDVGQSDIGPPCTIAYAHVAKPVTDLFRLKTENTFFIGSTSPREDPDKVISGVAALKTEILSKANVDFVIVNTDGWTENEKAVQFKSKMAASLEPDVIFCLQAEDEKPSFCAELGDALAGFRQERADSPSAILVRSSEKRRVLRELGFAKYLENARVKVFPLNYITVIDEGSLIRERKADNLLVGLFDTRKAFLGIGVLRAVDYSRKSLKVLTSVNEKPGYVAFGKIRLDDSFYEIKEEQNFRS